MKKTRTAILVNADGKPTRHKFTRQEPVTETVIDELADGKTAERQVTGAAQIYQCTETGAERRWGFES